MTTSAGYSLVEVLVVVAIGFVLSAMAGYQIISSRATIRSDGAMRVVMSEIRMARELAITERRYMRVTTTAPNRIQIEREDVPGPGTTVVKSKDIEGGIEFALTSGVPDTPDAFGMNAPVDFGSVINVKFTPDGTLVDEDGASTNGTIFLAIPSDHSSARAVTILGSTGRIRGYRWDGRQWKLV